jgi:hypothetical protein
MVPRVVFPTGLDARPDGALDIYYGMADTRIGVARAWLDGLQGNDMHTLDEIANHLRLTREEGAPDRARALAKLRTSHLQTEVALPPERTSGLCLG